MTAAHNVVSSVSNDGVMMSYGTTRSYVTVTSHSELQAQNRALYKSTFAMVTSIHRAVYVLVCESVHTHGAGYYTGVCSYSVMSCLADHVRTDSPWQTRHAINARWNYELRNNGPKSFGSTVRDRRCVPLVRCVRGVI